MGKTKGRVTLPSETNFLKETQEIMERWGADAIRDSDGTKLSDDIKQLDAKIYTTYFVSRGHNEHAQKHMDECQQIYLLSKYCTAHGNAITIPFMEGYYAEQITPDYNHDPKEWWEVIDRTTDEIIPPESWELDEKANTVTIRDAKSFHAYTVSFLTYAIWDPTQMYNHITNNWGDKPHDIPFDIRGTASGVFAKEYLQQWLQENPDTDVVRFTTFFYHFTLVFNDKAKEKFVDWFGYGASVSADAILAFEKEKGYRIRPEHLINQGYYNSTFKVPTKEYRDYMDFIQHFVAMKAKELVDMVHAAGKEAMMFLGDNWIGTEPYGKYFGEIGLDAVVGSVGGGATLRLISDIPHVKYTEGRFLPYFFPDTFYEGNDPCIEARENWISARRALFRSPVDRIGYGGYLSLAYKFPKFVDYIEEVADEYRMLYDNVKAGKPYSGLKVAILNAWGKIRSWQCFMVAHALWYKQIYSYLGILESLSGASVDVEFISFDDVKEHGIPEDVDVIINAGDGGTAFSGDTYWADEEIITKLRRWVYEGGGFVGVGEPSAYLQNGHYFQLYDVLGIDKEMGYTLSTDKYYKDVTAEHFITEDHRRGMDKSETAQENNTDSERKEHIADGSDFDFGESMKNVYALEEDTQILEYSNGEIHLSSHDYGKGRGVYIAGLPYSFANTRLLMRSLYAAAHKEADYKKWYADDIYCEVHAYPAAKEYAIVNNSSTPRTTTVYDGTGNATTYELKAGEVIWKTIE